MTRGALYILLRYNLSELPPSWQPRLCHDLEHRWQTAFFELIVARTLQALGAAELGVELADETGRKPDFLAAFGNGKMVVEATTPEFLTEHNEHSQRVSELKRMIEDAAPEGWSIAILELPDIGFNESKQEFKRALRSLLRLPPPDARSEAIEWEEEISSGLITLKLLPKRISHTAVVGGPAFAAWSDSVARIRRAIKTKRSQVRNAEHPAILAINGGFGATIGDFRRALFGSWSRVVSAHDNSFVDEFAADGVFARRRDGEPTYAGVLAYEEVGFTCPREPVLFLHPRYRSEMPEELQTLETHRLVDWRQIEVAAARNPDVLRSLRPVDLGQEPLEDMDDGSDG